MARNVHACFATQYVGPHWTTTQTSKITKAMCKCGNVGKAEKSYIKLFETETLRERG